MRRMHAVPSIAIGVTMLMLGATAITTKVSPDGELLDGPAEGRGTVIANPACYPCRLVYPNIRSGGRGKSLVAWINNAEVSGTNKDVRGAVVSRRLRRARVSVSANSQIDAGGYERAE